MGHSTRLHVPDDLRPIPIDDVKRRAIPNPGMVLADVRALAFLSERKTEVGGCAHRRRTPTTCRHPITILIWLVSYLSVLARTAATPESRNHAGVHVRTRIPRPIKI